MEKKIVFKETGISVQIGTIVEINDITFPLTEQIVKENPHLFEIKDDKDALLEKAKKEYPIGTWVKSLYENDIEKISSNKYIDSPWFSGDGVWTSGTHHGLKIYSNGKWAEKALFVTEDGKPIFHNDIYYYIDDCIGLCFDAFADKNHVKPSGKTFSTMRIAKEYLQAYNKWLKNGCKIDDSVVIVDGYRFQCTCFLI